MCIALSYPRYISSAMVSSSLNINIMIPLLKRLSQSLPFALASIFLALNIHSLMKLYDEQRSRILHQDFGFPHN